MTQNVNDVPTAYDNGSPKGVYLKSIAPTPAARYEDSNTSHVLGFIAEVLGGYMDKEGGVFDRVRFPYRNGVVEIRRSYDQQKRKVFFDGEITPGLESSVQRILHEILIAERKIIETWEWMSSARYGYFDGRVREFLESTRLLALQNQPSST